MTLQTLGYSESGFDPREDEAFDDVDGDDDVDADFYDRHFYDRDIDDLLE
jgi:hypothetical protein